MDYGNICALICRVLTLILLIYGLILSSFYVLPSCHFISAVSTNDETHGVGLLSFETDKQECIPHNNFIKEHYNGMELAAKIGGYTAPGLSALIIVWLLGECCKKNGCWSGKCIPALLLLFCIIAQGLTFLIFQSKLFCNNEDIKQCALGSAAFKSIQACVVYVAAFIMFYVGPTPKPLTGMIRTGSSSRTVTTAASNESKSSKDPKKKKKTKSEPAADEAYSKEMYEQRRKEKKIKGKGVSGRSKKEIFDDLNGVSESKEKEEPYDETQIIKYDPETGQRREDEKNRNSTGRTSPQPLYGDYVDEPDGMDWSAYSPNERDEYQERKRAKKKREKEKKEQERRERERREQEWREKEKRELEKQRYYDDDRRGYSDRRRPSQDEETFRSEYTEDDYYRQPSRGDETEYTEDQYDDRDRRYDDRDRGYYDRDRGYDRSDNYEDSYQESYRSNDYGYGRHEDSYRSGGGKYDESYRSNRSDRSGDRRGEYDYDDSYSYQSGQDEFSAYDSRAGDSYYDKPQDDGGYYGRSGRDDESYGYDSRADDYYQSPRSRQSDRGGYYS